MKFVYLIVIGVSFVTVSFSEEILFGACPIVPTQSNFDLNAYIGQWYELQKYEAIFEKGLTCNQAIYSLKADGSVLVNNTGYNSTSQEWTSAIGDAIGIDLSNGKLGVRFSPLTPRASYNVLETDYSTYALVWSCVDLERMNVQYLWILARQSSIPAEEVNKLRNKLTTTYKLDVNRLKTTPQNCRV